MNDKSNKHTLPWWLVAALMIAAGGLMSGCNAQKVADLEARIVQLEKQSAEGKFKAISIVNEEGKEQAVLGMRKDGTPQLKMVDKEGNNRVLLRLHADGTPVLVMWGKGTKSSVYLSVPGEGPPQMMMFDKTGSQKLKLP